MSARVSKAVSKKISSKDKYHEFQREIKREHYTYRFNGIVQFSIFNTIQRTIRSIIDSNAVEFNSQLDDVLNNSNDMIEFSGFVVYLSNTDGKSFLNLIFFFFNVETLKLSYIMEIWREEYKVVF